MKKPIMVFILSVLICCTVVVVSAADGTIVSNWIEPDPSITLLEPTPTPDPKAVRITIIRQQTMMTGDPVKLISELHGFDGCEVNYQWQCDKGSGFEDVAGANGATYTFPATAESLRWSWRLTVYYYD